MKQEVKIGQTDYTVLILIRDTTGVPKTALTFASAGLDVCYTRVETDNDVVTTAGAPVVTTLTGVHVDWGFVLVDDTNCPGLYKLDIADGVFAAGAWSAVVSVICTGCDPVHIEFVLVPEAPMTGVVTASYTGNTVQTGDAYPGVAVAAAYAIVNSGVGFRGTVTAANPGVSFTIGSLAGLGAGAFVDATTPWYAYVFRDAGGLAAAPQGEVKAVTGYTTASGLFTTAAFTVPVAAGDDVIIQNPRLADTAAIRVVTDKLAAAASTLVTGTVDTTAFAATTTQFEADDITTATADHYNGRLITFTSGTLINQQTDITDYSLVAGRAHFTVTALTSAPANDVTFVIQ